MTQTSNRSDTPEIKRSDDDIKKLAKRITMLMRELEAHSMDMVLYAKPLAEGKFPQTHIVQVANTLESAIKELSRVQHTWLELFKEDKNEFK